MPNQLNNPAGSVTGKVNEPKVKLGPKLNGGSPYAQHSSPK